MPNALESDQHCVRRTGHANPYCKSSRRSGKIEEHKHQRPLLGVLLSVHKRAMLSIHIAALVSQRHSLTENNKCLTWVQQLQFWHSHRASLFLRIVLEMPFMSTGAPSIEMSQSSTTLTFEKNLLNRASVYVQIEVDVILGFINILVK